MIGGSDVVFSAPGNPDTLEACVRIVAQFWPAVRFEAATTGEKYHRIAEIPFGQVDELLLYIDAEAEEAWDTNDPLVPENSMLYLLARPREITLVLDDPEASVVRKILDAIRRSLCEYMAMPIERAA